MKIGKRLKELRLANELTQDELALRAGLTKSFISLLERDKSSISLDALSEVLTVLGVDLATFFSDDARPVLIYDRRDRVLVEDLGVESCELLIPGSTTMTMDPYLLSLSVGETMGPEPPHSGEEFGYVIKGRVTVKIGKMSSVAGAGSCFLYKAQHEHSIANSGGRPAEVLLVTCPPQR